jgi:hypothetical protein
MPSPGLRGASFEQRILAAVATGSSAKQTPASLRSAHFRAIDLPVGQSGKNPVKLAR